MLFSIATFAQDAKPAENPLAPVAWLVGDWHTTAGPPGEKPTEIDNHIYWSETKTAIFFVTRFNGVPHYSGMYAYDPEAKHVSFWYVDTDGNFSKGTARLDGQRLVQELTIAHPNGNADPLVSYIDRTGGDDKYHWQVLRPGETKPMLELDYTRKK